MQRLSLRQRAVAPLTSYGSDQNICGDQHFLARRSKHSYSHPLAPKDPASRNIVIPDNVHAKARSADTLPAEVLQKRAQRALLIQLQQNVLWEGTVVDDERHRLIQHFIKLRDNPKYCSSRQMMVVGGKEMLRELFEQGHKPRHILVREGREVPTWAKNEGKKTEIVRVSRRVAEICSPGNDGFIGDFDIPTPPLKENLIANKQRLDRVIVLDNIDEPGLLGTVLRAAAGFHYDAIITTNHCADLYDHRVIRAARGAHFQKTVPIYALKEEDGDHVYGMLNHIVERNNLLPVCFTPLEDDVEKQTSTCIANSSSKIHRESLSDYCLNHFSRSDNERGHLIMVGPNHKRNSVRRWSRQLVRPMTQLLLDELPQTDALIGLSVVLHALRPHGNWDYLPTAEPSVSNATLDLQTRRASVDMGADRLELSERDLNLDEDEQIEKARLDNELMQARRLQRFKLTDYDRWMEAESRRIAEMSVNEKRKMETPWEKLRWRHQKGASNLPPSVPNIIDEYRMPLDRDALREEREISETFVRPGNYDP